MTRFTQKGNPPDCFYQIERAIPLFFLGGGIGKPKIKKICMLKTSLEPHVAAAAPDGTWRDCCVQAVVYIAKKK